MSDDITLRQKAREAIVAGKLPHRRAERMLGGPGVGSRCAVCDEPVEHNELEYELEFTRGNDPSQASYHVHLRCFAAWAYVCRYFGTAREEISTSSPMRSAAPSATDGGASESLRGTAAIDWLLPKAGNGGTIVDCEPETTPKEGPWGWFDQSAR